jgi:putative tryptophan/tyrosine transport system substrate-binding protein
MRRREFIAGIGGAVAWPLAARAQQGSPMRRVGVLMNLAADDPEAQARLAAFHQGLQELGWIVGRNVTIDYRWGVIAADSNRKLASELVALAPDVILAAGAAADAVHQVTTTVPIIFAGVIDPVGRGLITSLARPGGNATGFTPFEFSLSGKLLQLLKQIAPKVKRVAVVRDTIFSAAGIGQFGAIQAIAPSLGVEVKAVDVGNAADIERAITAFVGVPDGGLVVPRSAAALVHRQVIITLAAKYRLPAVYASTVFAADGGLLSYGPDDIDSYRQAAGYIDRILKGEKPADLPVQVPTKFQLVINMKTAKALGLTVPETLLAIADEVIQ